MIVNPNPLPLGGLRAIGDVHGCIDAFTAAAEPAQAAGRFVLQLGDLVDRGPDSPACLRLALSLRETGAGQFIRGNHDDKLARLLSGNPVRAPTELTHTQAQIDAAADAVALRARFLTAWQQTPWWLHLGAYLFVHGAFHPAMLDHARPEAITPARTRRKVEYLALHGEGSVAEGETLPQRTYNWVEAIPPGLTVVVGHDVRSEITPLVTTNAAGGRVIFLDTGCGKGGKLSCLDLALEAEERLTTQADTSV